MAQYARGTHALGECDRCGLTWKLGQLRYEFIDKSLTNLRVCPDCWNPDHPQLQAGKRAIVDYEVLRDPRPDRRPSGLTNIRWGWNPVYAVEAKLHVGDVVVRVYDTNTSVLQPTTQEPVQEPTDYVRTEDEITDEIAASVRALAAKLEDPTYW